MDQPAPVPPLPPILLSSSTPLSSPLRTPTFLYFTLNVLLPYPLFYHKRTMYLLFPLLFPLSLFLKSSSVNIRQQEAAQQQQRQQRPPWQLGNSRR